MKKNVFEKKQSKKVYQRHWENTFGRHSARCHPSSLVDILNKEGKPILLLIFLGCCGIYMLSILIMLSHHHVY